MQQSKIEWTDTTWNPVTGCTKVSQGCKNCYAERLYERFHGKGSFKNVICHGDRLAQPYKWKTPQRVFVNSMSDLFHEAVPADFIAKVFFAMMENPQHTFQVLTKRPERMLAFFRQNNVANGLFSIQDPYDNFPKNVWLGVSVEDQKAADERIPLLLQTPAAVRFLSCEPLLGPVDLSKYLQPLICEYTDGSGQCYTLPPVNQVIAGGESGPGARPMHPDWARSLRDQCAAAGVPFFFKQWGEWTPFETEAQAPFHTNATTGLSYDGHILNFIDENGDPGKFMGHRWMDVTQAVLYCHAEQSEASMFLKTGKKKAGRLLDGVEHNGMPAIAAPVTIEPYDYHD